MRILVINGVNLNMLGIREPALYGNKDYCALVDYIQGAAQKLGLESHCFQSNYEGEIVSVIQQGLGRYDGIIINAGAYTHTSIAILDALKSVGIPAVEVHLTDIAAREDFRRFSYISLYAEKTICGLGFEGYKKALEHFASKTLKHE